MPLSRPASRRKRNSAGTVTPSGPGHSIECGVGLECSRSTGESLEAALRHAARIGFRWVEPFVYGPVRFDLNSHVALASSSAYHHIDVERSPRRRIAQLMRRLNLRFSAFDAHTSLLLPQVGVSQVNAALELASELECPFVVSDEGPVPTAWMPLERAFEIMCMSLDAIIPRARKLGVRFALELHNALTVDPAFLERVLRRYDPDDLGINFDTGNFFLSGRDPVAFLKRFAQRVVHVHLKDIPARQLAVRGRVTSTRVGVTVGEGVIDVPGVIAALGAGGFRGVYSIECDTWEQAESSRLYLQYMDRNDAASPS